MGYGAVNLVGHVDIRSFRMEQVYFNKMQSYCLLKDCTGRALANWSRSFERVSFYCTITCYSWLHVISSYAISTYAISTAVISTYYTFKRLQFQPHAISTACNFNRFPFQPILISSRSLRSLRTS